MTAIGLGLGIPFNQQGFSPFAVGQPIVLLDAAKGITLNGADVSDWAGQAGNGNDVSQSTAADQPLFNVSDANFNGQPSLTFDGVSEKINRVTFTGGAISQPNTMFVVYKVTTAATSQTLVDGSTTRNMIRTSGGTFEMFAGTVQSLHLTNTNPHVLAALFDGVSSDSWRDGIQDTPAGSPGTNTMNGITIGDQPSGGSEFEGEIAYVLIYNSNLSDAEKNYIGNGLAARFGTTWTDI